MIEAGHGAGQHRDPNHRHARERPEDKGQEEHHPPRGNAEHLRTALLRRPDLPIAHHCMLSWLVSRGADGFQAGWRKIRR